MSRGGDPMLDRVGFLALAVCACAVPFLFPGFLLFQISLALTYAMAVMGLNLLLGFNGQISMAQGVFFAVGGYVSAFLTARGVPYWATPVAAMAASGALGWIVGIPALRLRGMQLSITTLGLAAIVPPLALRLADVTGGVNGIALEKPVPPPWFAGDQDTWLYVLCVGGALLCTVVMVRLVHGSSGRALRAVRDNSLIAESQGVDIVTVKLSVFTVSACFAGLGGCLFALLNGFLSPDSFPLQLSFDFVVAAVIGGVRSIAGAFLGALIVVFLPEWTGSIDRALVGVVDAACLILIMLLARGGLVGMLRATARRLGAARLPWPVAPVPVPNETPEL